VELVERFFNKIKQCRRVATRHDKLAVNYLAFVKLASIRIWLRANESRLAGTIQTETLPNDELPLLPSTPVSRLAAGGAAEGGFTRGGGLEDAAFRTCARVVGRRLARRGAVGAIGQGLGPRISSRWGLLTFDAAGLADPLPNLESELRSPRTPQGGRERRQCGFN
jgi:hypothetical protein